LNGTVAKTLRELRISESDDLVVCNAEIGGRMLIEEDYLSQADTIGGEGRCTIEFLTSGKFLPTVFLSTIEYLSENGVPEFVDVVKFLNEQGDQKERMFRSRHISALLEDDQERLREERPEVFDFPEALPLLEALALRIVERSARLCAMVAYATVANRFDEKSDFKVALDSRLARAISFFRELLQQTLETITPEGKRIEVELLHGLDGVGGRITVPMQGAANALDRLF
jgi:hexokinase